MIKPGKYSEGGLWIRPAKKWNETVAHNGRLVNCFTRIDEIDDNDDTHAMKRFVNFQWVIPKGTLKPIDSRTKAVKQ